MSLEQKLSELQVKQKQVSKIKAEIQKDSEELFDQYCKDIFQNNPKLKSFSWSQYTPYFNDGSPCIFHANTHYIKVNGESLDESNWYQKRNIINYGKWDNKTKSYVNRQEVDNNSYDEELSKVSDKIINFLSSFDNEFYANKFGDHCEIIVTEHGISIDELDHE